jgi:hypothetical protein
MGIGSAPTETAKKVRIQKTSLGAIGVTNPSYMAAGLATCLQVWQPACRSLRPAPAGFWFNEFHAQPPAHNSNLSKRCNGKNSFEQQNKHKYSGGDGIASQK